MKLQILYTPIISLHACITASFKLRLQTPLCIIAATSQYMLCDIFLATRPTAGLEANDHQILPWSYQPYINIVSSMVFHQSLAMVHIFIDVFLLETNRLHITTIVFRASCQHAAIVFLPSIIGCRSPLMFARFIALLLMISDLVDPPMSVVISHIMTNLSQLWLILNLCDHYQFLTNLYKNCYKYWNLLYLQLSLCLKCWKYRVFLLDCPYQLWIHQFISRSILTVDHFNVSSGFHCFSWCLVFWANTKSKLLCEQCSCEEDPFPCCLFWQHMD